MGRRDWRGVLARLPLPMLALAASYGVYSFAALFVPWPVAVAQAAAFELTYIGLAVTRDLAAPQRRRATAISIGAVVASIVYNTLAGWFHRQPGLLDAASPVAWLMFAVLHGAPLAWVAYLVADLLLHSDAGVHARRSAQLRALVRRLAQALRTTRAELAPLSAMLAHTRADLAQALREHEAARAELAHTQIELAQVRAELAQACAEQMQAQHAAAQHHARVAQLERDAAHVLREHEAALRDHAQVAAQLRAERDELRASAALDLRTLARRLGDAGVGSRELAQLLGVPESTVRSWRKAASNGHALEAVPS